MSNPDAANALADREHQDDAAASGRWLRACGASEALIALTTSLESGHVTVIWHGDLGVGVSRPS